VALERRPVVSGAVITCGWVGMTLALAELPPDPFWGPVYVNGVGFLAGLAFLGLLGRRRAVGLDHLRGGLLVIPVVLICATEAWPGLGSSFIEAGAFGFAFAALRLRGTSLWWLIATHAFADYVSIMSPGAPPGWQQGALVLAEIGYGLWTLTRLPRDDVATQAPAFTL
jgi:hypothetical protein